MREHLATLLDDFRRYGREIAVVRHVGVRRRVTTYGQIAELAGRFAAFLDRRGIVQGDRVLLWADNSAEWIAAFHGCLLRGVLAVPLDAAGSADFAARVAADVSPKMAVGDLVLIDQLPVGIPRMAFENWPAALPQAPLGPVAGLSAGTPLQILFTSGTTGEPKGIVLTHGNVLASFEPIERASQPYLRYERMVHPLRILHTLPLSHVFGQTMGLWVPSIYRAELHLESRLVASRLVETIRRERISVLAAVPRVYALLKTHLEATLPGLSQRIEAVSARRSAPARTASAKARNALRRWWSFRDVHRAFGLKFWALISGGGALPQPVEAFWNAVGLVVVQGYGMTETTALITLNHPFHVAKGTIGKPLAGREVKLGDDGEVLVRGASISPATWSGGALHPRTSEWLATGDLAQTEPTGELRFLGRKSEVIVTASGVNLHPEDLEAAIEQEPGVAACAVVPVETAAGPEPIAVLALRGPDGQAAAVIAHANAHLAEFQRLRRWIVWPDPDLPRTSTGKVRRKALAASVAQLQAAREHNGNGHKAGNSYAHAGSSYRRNSSNDEAGSVATLSEPASFASDWLLTLIAQISGEPLRLADTPGSADTLLLSEDLHLDSLGRVQLSAAIEERTGIANADGRLDDALTLGDLRRLIAAAGMPAVRQIPVSAASDATDSLSHSAHTADGSRAGADLPTQRGWAMAEESAAGSALSHSSAKAHRYPLWPWRAPMTWLRTAFLEAVMRPLVRLLANPAVTGSVSPASEPMLIVANHVTGYDVPLLAYALPPELRRRIAVAMSAEMLEDFRHFRNGDRTQPSSPARKARFYLPGPLFYLLLTAFFNVFPLPRLRDFQRSFAHAGHALDKGMHVLLFPEGARSRQGRLAQFRPGIGMLVKQSTAPVLPMAIRGLGEIKAAGRGWFRAGTIEVCIGEPMRFSPLESEAEITARLHDAVQTLLTA